MAYKIVKYIKAESKSSSIRVKRATILKNEEGKYFVQLKLENTANMSVCGFSIRYKDAQKEQLLTYSGFEIVPSDFFFSHELIEIPTSFFELIEIGGVKTITPSETLMKVRQPFIENNKKKFMGYSSLEYYYAGGGFLLLSIILFIMVACGINKIFILMAVLSLLASFILMGFGAYKMACYRKDRKSFFWYKNTRSLLYICGASVLVCLLSLSVCIPVSAKENTGRDNVSESSSSGRKTTSSETISSETVYEKEFSYLNTKISEADIEAVNPYSYLCEFFPLKKDGLKMLGNFTSDSQWFSIGISENDGFSLAVSFKDYSGIYKNDLYNYLNSSGYIKGTINNSEFGVCYELDNGKLSCLFPVAVFDEVCSYELSSFNTPEAFSYYYSEDLGIIVTVIEDCIPASGFVVFFDNIYEKPFSGGAGYRCTCISSSTL